MFFIKRKKVILKYIFFLGCDSSVYLGDLNQDIICEQRMMLNPRLFVQLGEIVRYSYILLEYFYFVVINK